MPNTTARLGLTQPIGADTPSELRVSVTNSTGILDSATLYSSGTLSSRPASPVAGTFYFATDTTTLYCYDGTEWLLAGLKDSGWVALTLINGWTTISGTYTPAYRLIGNTVRLRGGIDGTSATASQIATLPTVVRPTALVKYPMVGASSGTVSVSTAGVLNCSTTGVQSYIDEVQYDLT